MSRNILVVAAHPDDEVLGCAGAIALHSLNGDDVNVLILAQGISSRSSGNDKKQLVRLRDAAERANKILGASSLTFENFPDNRMDSVDRLDIVKTVEVHIENLNPSIVYTHHAGDLNIDHQITHAAVITACRPMPNNQVVTILSFEVPSSTEWQAPSMSTAFQPNWYVDIGDTLENKIQALNAYKLEMRAWPHARSIVAVEHLARWRGSTVGVDAAEAFMLNRQIILSGEKL